MAAARRRVARVVVMDDRDEVLLLLTRDPHRPEHHWMLPPGGGTRPTETDEDGARRELQEETGIVAARMHRLATIPADYMFAGILRRQTETIFLARLPARPQVRLPGGTEGAAIIGYRWLRRDRLPRRGLHPPGLASLLVGLPPRDEES